MRESLIAILVLLAVMGGYYHLKKLGLTFVPKLAPAEKSSLAQPMSLTKGKKNDKASTHEHARPHSNSRKSQGSTNEADETENFPSLYSTSEESGERRVENKGKTERSIIKGVPVQGWIDSQRFSLSSLSEPAPSETGMRVFLQCIELKKKGAEYLKERDCQSLLAVHHAPKLRWQ